MPDLVQWLDLLGVAVFAASGALVASRKEMDAVFDQTAARLRDMGLLPLCQHGACLARHGDRIPAVTRRHVRDEAIVVMLPRRRPRFGAHAFDFGVGQYAEDGGTSEGDGDDPHDLVYDDYQLYEALNLLKGLSILSRKDS